MTSYAIFNDNASSQQQISFPPTRLLPVHLNSTLCKYCGMRALWNSRKIQSFAYCANVCFPWYIVEVVFKAPNFFSRTSWVMILNAHLSLMWPSLETCQSKFYKTFIKTRSQMSFVENPGILSNLATFAQQRSPTETGAVSICPGPCSKTRCRPVKRTDSYCYA